MCSPITHVTHPAQNSRVYNNPQRDTFRNRFWQQNSIFRTDKFAASSFNFHPPAANACSTLRTAAALSETFAHPESGAGVCDTSDGCGSGGTGQRPPPRPPRCGPTAAPLSGWEMGRTAGERRGKEEENKTTQQQKKHVTKVLRSHAVHSVGLDQKTALRGVKRPAPALTRTAAALPPHATKPLPGSSCFLRGDPAAAPPGRCAPGAPGPSSPRSPSPPAPQPGPPSLPLPTAAARAPPRPEPLTKDPRALPPPPAAPPGPPRPSPPAGAAGRPRPPQGRGRSPRARAGPPLHRLRGHRARSPLGAGSPRAPFPARSAGPPRRPLPEAEGGAGGCRRDGAAW